MGTDEMAAEYTPPDVEVLRYQTVLRQQQAAAEARCRRCGICCGANDDPCVHLRRQDDGQSWCDIYPRRLGTHTTRSGARFRCVEIRALPQGFWPGALHCAYRGKKFF
ncbi:MAG: hypothetical protein NC924_08850 [Candidatus Omnitrophica bacterium]|nr:hypothetical protein [Candidatus Omnitrophota bacterium]